MKLLVLIMAFLSACSVEPQQKDSRKIIVLEGCQYWEFASINAGSASTYSLTHKGNCSNPIHICK